MNHQSTPSDRAVLGRRQFLMMMGAAGGLLAMGTGSRMSLAESGLQVVSESAKALGSEVTIKVLHADRAVAEKAIRAAFKELADVESILSIYCADSEVARLNRDGVVDRPNRMLVEVLAKAEEMSNASNGAFDVTVQPLWQVYADANKSGKLPSDQQIAQARAKVDWHKLKVTEERITLKDPCMAITLNGIAQ
jgi:FAD:protein FMN transferase